MKNLFAPYYCNFSTRFLNILSSISKTVDMYTLDYVKNYEDLDQTLANFQKGDCWYNEKEH